MNKSLPDMSWEKLSALINILGSSAGRPDEDHPLPQGPWGPVVRAALERVIAFGPTPEPWNTGISSAARVALIALLTRHPELGEGIGGGFGGRISFNPQPLPPRARLMAAIANIVIERAEFMHDIGLAMQSEGEQHAINIVGGYVQRFTDWGCGNEPHFTPKIPRPLPHWLNEKIDGSDLIVLGASFNQAALLARGEPLADTFAGAARTFVETGVARLA